MRPLHWPVTMHDFNRKLNGQRLFRIAAVKCPGTWAGPELGFQADIARQLNPHIFAHLNSYYGESFGPVAGPIDSPSYIDTVREGVDFNVSILSDLDAQIILLGYSKGAQVVYETAREFLPGGRLAHRERDLLSIVTLGDPCGYHGTINVGFDVPGIGIANRSPLPEHLARRHLRFSLVDDMYCNADPAEDYLWIGYAALAGEYDRPGSGLQFRDPGALAMAMLQLIQRDEFVDAIAELLPSDFPGLAQAITELTGEDGTTLLEANHDRPRGGLLGVLLTGGPMLLTPAGLLSAGTGFIGGMIAGIPTIGPLLGGLLGGGSGKGGTKTGWFKMGRTVSKLLAFAASQDHNNYWAPHRAVYQGKTGVQSAVDYLNYRGGQLL
jgi:hypothetical protein